MVTFNSSLMIAALIVVAMVIIYFLAPKLRVERIKDNTSVKQVAVSEENSLKEETGSKEDELELVAAIMGALSAYLDMPASKLKIKSIKRVDGTNSTWRREGIAELLEKVK